MTTHSVAIVQSILLGGGKPGNSFNDIDKVIGANDVTIDTKASISSIDLIYDQTSSAKDDTPKSHGTSYADCKDTKISKVSIGIGKSEHIIAISGKAGKTKDYGVRVSALCFAIYDSDTGKTRTTEMYGGSGGDAFRITANGYFVGFGGYAIDTILSLKELKEETTDGGLYGLTVFDIAYSKV
ncbi:hypothetical protein K438DRAFT_302035 [Mycena galopus ATCC 62051]|nr:hypothetical protein K438DRAFT_302035 [Mycena galopus ATCC 62051]